MCGIAGIIGKEEKPELVMQKMLHKQHHRGPDSQGMWQDENVVLGHNRLSIIDLSDSANQPMHSLCERYVLVFNGEIYNYKELKQELSAEYNFQTQSDSEVILAAYKQWGREMLHRFNGMFAFAIWDKKEEILFAARDRFGVKPFYYAFWQNCLYFASEIKTLWAAGIPREKNLSVWAKYLAYGSYGMPDETFWEGVLQLPGGHYFNVIYNSTVELDSSRLIPQMWYNFVERVQNIPQMEIEELKETYQTLLLDSINLRFRADVPVGFNVSGGLDSSALLALVNQAFPENKSIEAFTFYTGHSSYDELPWVEEIIKKTENPLNKVLLGVDAVEKLIEQVSYFEDEPFGGFPTLAYSLIFKRAREKGVTVLLDGQGMDEAWAGYDYYHTGTGFTVQGTKSSPVRPEVLKPDFLELAKKENYPQPFDSHIQNLQYRDLFYTKIPRALRFNDRVSMMHSTELREPFLDYRLVELAFAQKDEVKIRNGQSKWLLREFVKDVLGDRVALAPKRPLQTPQREWMANELNDYTNSSLRKLRGIEFVDSQKVSLIWKNYQSGNSDNSFYLWQWINLVKLQNV